MSLCVPLKALSKSGVWTERAAAVQCMPLSRRRAATSTLPSLLRPRCQGTSIGDHSPNVFDNPGDDAIPSSQLLKPLCLEGLEVAGSSNTTEHVFRVAPG